MQNIDYNVTYDPNKENELDLFSKIIYSLILRRILFKKPSICHVSGKSGEGKSLSVLFIMYILLKMQNLDIKKYMDITNIFTQMEYPQKLKQLLHNKEYKKINVVCVHEGREAMEAKEWFTLFNRNIAHVNALCRALKRMAIFIVSQSIRDITKEIRYTLDYQIKIYRRMHKGVQGHARLIWYVLYMDDRDIENPKLRKRRVQGWLNLPNGRRILHKPQYFSIPLIEKEIKDFFEETDKAKKMDILNRRLEDMEKDLKDQLKTTKDKIQSLVNFYMQNENSRMEVFRTTPKGKYKVIKDFAKLHDLKPSEVKIFEEKFKERLENEITGV